jgi:hypothetical protein
MLTTRSATPADIWPDGSGLSAKAEREIMAIAGTITPEEVAGSGVTLAAWYAPFFLAERRWRQQQEQRTVQQERERVDETDNARRIAKLEARLNKAIDHINANTKKNRANFEALNAIIFGKASKSPDEDPNIIKIISGVCWRMMLDGRVMRDAGVWDDTRQYHPGDTTTCDGLMWAAQVKHKGQRPGDGVAWRLLHKSDIAELKSMIRAAVRDELRKKEIGK